VPGMLICLITLLLWLRLGDAGDRELYDSHRWNSQPYSAETFSPIYSRDANR